MLTAQSLTDEVNSCFLIATDRERVDISKSHGGMKVAFKNMDLHLAQNIIYLKQILKL